MLKNYLMKKELKKFNKLIKSKSVVIITEGEQIISLYDKNTKKTYVPTYQVMNISY